MVLEFKIGTFTARTTVGSQTVTGVGFTPKAVLLFSTGNTAFDTFSGDIQYYPGFAASAVEQRSYAVLGFDNSATSDTDSGYNTTSTIADNTFTNTHIAELTAFNSDGFVLDWVTNNGTAWRILYVAIGGTDVTNAKVGAFNSPAVTGDNAVTGVGFEPEIVFLLGTNFTADDTYTDLFGTFCHGMFNSAGEQGVVSLISLNGTAAMDTARYQRTDKCFATFSTTSTSTLTHEATFVSMDNDGFTLNYTTASVANKRVAYLALRGLQSKIDSFTSPTAGTAPVEQAVTGTGFAPEGVLFFTTGKTAGTSIVAHNRLSTGMAHLSDEEGCLWFGDEDAALAAVTGRMMETDTCIRVSDEVASVASSTTQALADFTSLDADGFTLNWSVKDASNAYQVIYVALGDAAVVGGGGTDTREKNTASLLRQQYNETARKRYSSTNMNP